MAHLMMHAQVLKHFHKLPKKVQKKVPELIEKFQINPWDTAIGLHGLKESMLDHKVRGADLPDGYRAIVIAPEQGDTFLLVHIDSHDRSYAWAKNKRFEVHKSTGAFQIFDVQETTEALQDAVTPKPTVDDYPLQNLADDYLFHAGVPHLLIPAVRQVKSDQELEVLSEYLPPECYEVLVGLVAGLSLDEALAQALGTDVEDEQPVTIVGPGDFSQLTQRPNRDLVVVEGEETLKAMLEGGSLEEWRIFLHPQQRKIVEWQTNGSMSITGAAGTGKTVALMHRAVYLAKHLNNPKERILLTTFTTNLSVTIKSYLRRLDPIAAEHIEVTNLNQLARTICSRSGWKGRIASPEELASWAKELIQDGFASHEICVTPYKPAIRTALEAEGVSTFELKPREEDPGPEEPGVRLGTMKRIKGLEFRAIAMGCSNESDAMNKLAEAELLQRCERYVAATRARERLLVCINASL